jgi:hypothetical protein
MPVHEHMYVNSVPADAFPLEESVSHTADKICHHLCYVLHHVQSTTLTKLCLPDMIFSTLLKITTTLKKNKYALSDLHILFLTEKSIYCTILLAWCDTQWNKQYLREVHNHFHCLNDSLQQNCMCKWWCAVNTVFKHHLSLSCDAVTHCCIL